MLTVGLVLGLGLFFAFLCWTRQSDRGAVVREPTGAERYLLALRAAARAELAAELRLRRGNLTGPVGVFQVNVRIRP